MPRTNMPEMESALLYSGHNRLNLSIDYWFSFLKAYLKNFSPWILLPLQYRLTVFKLVRYIPRFHFPVSQNPGYVVDLTAWSHQGCCSSFRSYPLSY